MSRPTETSKRGYTNVISQHVKRNSRHLVPTAMKWTHILRIKTVYFGFSNTLAANSIKTGKPIMKRAQPHWQPPEGKFDSGLKLYNSLTRQKFDASLLTSSPIKSVSCEM
ncbi:hypothetical protein LSAT2_007220 [Lamellibrachia satsuma]|nr:hypothetical protein LSAT2_007220 [Lamellibrachia satsuma]